MKSWLAKKVRSLLGVHESLALQRLAADRWGDLQRTFAELQAAIPPAIRRQAEAADSAAQAMIRALESIDARLEALRAAAARPAPAPLDQGDLEKLEAQGLFILGSARSGTTVLTKCLNRSPEIFLLEEPNFFQNQHIQDFCVFFNALHEAIGNCRYKGTYVSFATDAEAGPLGLMLRLCRQYRRVGAKVAIGPHDTYPPDWKQLYLDFHAKYFLRSPHLLTLRAPHETLWSMHKLFPSRPIPRLIEAWAESLALIIDVYRVCPNSYLLFFGDFGKARLDGLSRLLRIKIDVPESMLGGDQVRSRLESGELPPPLAPFGEFCRECTDLFDLLRANVSRDDLKYSGSAAEWYFFDELHRRAEDLAERSRAAAGLRLAA